MPTTKWTRHSSFPQANCTTARDGAVTRMRLREWSVGRVFAQGMMRGEEVASNLPDIVPGSDATGPGGRIVMAYREGHAEVVVYARSKGTATLQAFVGDNPVGGLTGPQLLIEVLERKAAKEDQISLATLKGKTVGISAPDAKSYEFEKNLTFAKGGDPKKIFVDVPDNSDHVVVCSHGGVPGAGDGVEKLCMFVGGMKVGAATLNIDNCEAAFAVLKDKIAPRAVIWLGGCNIGANTAFCKKAAKAAERPVVAPVMALPVKKFPKNKIDLLDRFAMTSVFDSKGESMAVSSLCGIQFHHKFELPH